MPTHVRESLKTLLSAIREDLVPNYIEDTAVNVGEKTLIIGTGSQRQITSLVQKIKELAPFCQIHLITRPALLEQIEKQLQEDDCAYPYSSDGFFSFEGVCREIRKETIASLDSVIAVFNNAWGVGYENIYTILQKFNTCKNYTFNVEERFCEVNPLIIHNRIKSLSLNKTLSDWYWENGLQMNNEN